MLIVKVKNGERVIAFESNDEDMVKKFDELKKDSDFDTIELTDRRGRLYQQASAKPAKKKAAKKSSE